jgi:hypothetical protein
MASLSKIILFVFILTTCSCSSNSLTSKKVSPPQQLESSKHFSDGEVILPYELLNKIFDQEMAPLECVPNSEEAGLLLRTLRPRMELIEDDMEASLDDDEKVRQLISSCQDNCICSYVEDLLKEHQVDLPLSLKKSLHRKNSPKDISRCLNFARTTFCQSELYKELNKEKVDFSFEEMP